MEATLIALALTVAGLYFGIRNVRMLRSEAALRAYIQTSPKAAAWVSQYGVEGAMAKARKTSIPAGIAVAAVLLGAGLWFLAQLYL